SYIASNFSKDVRSLEGAINRLLFYSINFSKEDHISLKLATEAFRDQLTENKNELNISAIRRTVCDYYNLTKQQIISKNRTKNIANARNIAMYLCRKLLDAPYKDIGNEFGKRDHTTVMSSCDRVEQLIKTDSRYLKAINEIESRIK
ncbi:MAG: chromosomal replication initiator protein DnaA, partial [Erysipelotrichaceae bacterium]|nr:chromosomal replication initiator protein DnaA [Erysipelotrichaceae bacterium]